ncbi:serine protease [Cellulosimicrobium funkei]|nr:serine protease [Cellulosimicrobium funkei]
MTETPSVPTSWADTFEEVGSGVVRIANATCEGPSASGSGFLVDDDLVVTNFHVIAEAAYLTVGPNAVPAEVIGYNQDVDLTLLRLSGGVDGHVFSWVEEDLRVGDEAATLGFPAGGGVTSNQGAVSSVNPEADFLHDTVQYI